MNGHTPQKLQRRRTINLIISTEQTSQKKSKKNQMRLRFVLQQQIEKSV